MPLLLHAISWTTEAPVVAAAGLRGQPLARFIQGGLAAWATDWSGPRNLARGDLPAVINLVGMLGDALPARLPTWFDDAEGLRAALRVREPELAEALRHVAGRVELALTAAWTTPPTLATDDAARPSTPGTRYLRERQRAIGASDARRARAAALRDLVATTVAGDLVEAQHRLAPSAMLALSSALLVPRGAAGLVRGRLEQLGPAHRDVRILVHGPWPPYSFARITVSTA